MDPLSIPLVGKIAEKYINAVIADHGQSLLLGCTAGAAFRTAAWLTLVDDSVGHAFGGVVRNFICSPRYYQKGFAGFTIYDL